MIDNIKEQMTQKVRDFIASQEGYDAIKHEKLKVGCEAKDTWVITYGQNVQEGIARFGATADEAFDDFVLNWEKFKGFKWFEKTYD